MGFCPECGEEYQPEIAACPKCRIVLVTEPPPAPGPVVVHRVPDATAGAMLCGILQHNGIHAILRSSTIPAYGIVRRDWGTTAWGEIIVPAAEAEEARAIITDYLTALEEGGRVRDEDVEEPE